MLLSIRQDKVGSEIIKVRLRAFDYKMAPKSKDKKRHYQPQNSDLSSKKQGHFAVVG